MRNQHPGQIELPFAERKAPKVALKHVQRLVETLAAHGRKTAAEICALWGWPPSEGRKRRIRAIARVARPGVISHPNSDGYQLLKNCTAEDFSDCIHAIDDVIRDYILTKKIMQDAWYSGNTR